MYAKCNAIVSSVCVLLAPSLHHPFLFTQVVAEEEEDAK